VPEATCFIHAGTHKTGTTSIQQFLAANPVALASAGILIPRYGRPHPHFAGHHNVARELFGDPRFLPEKGGLAEIMREIVLSGAESVCLSSEDFEFLGSRPAELERFVDAVAATGYRPVFIFYLRPQTSYCSSLAIEFSRGDTPTTVEMIAAGALANGAYGESPYTIRLDYEELLAPFAAVAGPANVIARPYLAATGDTAALLHDVARVIAPPGREIPLELLRIPGRLNVSHGAPPFPAGLIAAFDARFGPGNARIGERYGFTLPVA
jgi:hypothetical protein